MGCKPESLLVADGWSYASLFRAPFRAGAGRCGVFPLGVRLSAVALPVSGVAVPVRVAAVLVRVLAVLML